MMYRQCVVGVFRVLDEARDALASLDRAGFSQEQVSLVTSNVAKQVEHEEMLDYGDQTERRAAAGAGVGGLVGLLVASPLLTVPGIGPVLMAGPIAAGGIVGGFLGAMIGWGVEPHNVERYQELVREGAVLVVVEGKPDEVAEAQRILGDSQAEAVHLHATSADEPAEREETP